MVKFEAALTLHLHPPFTESTYKKELEH